MPTWARRWSAWVLIAANLLPLAGAIFYDWSAFDIVFLYWLENVVIGFYNVGKMFVIGLFGPRPHPWPAAPAKKLIAQAATVVATAFCAGFFIFHYGLFTLVHGVFVIRLLGPEDVGPQGGLSAEVLYFARQIIMSGLAFAFLGLFLSHGFSFVYNFLYQREYERIGFPQTMVAPYGRVIVMHLTVLLGAWGIVVMSAPVILVALLVILKTAVDLTFHSVEHRTGAIAPGVKRRAI